MQADREGLSLGSSQFIIGVVVIGKQKDVSQSRCERIRKPEKGWGRYRHCVGLGAPGPGREREGNDVRIKPDGNIEVGEVLWRGRFHSLPEGSDLDPNVRRLLAGISVLPQIILPLPAAP